MAPPKGKPKGKAPAKKGGKSTPPWMKKKGGGEKSGDSKSSGC